MRCVINRSITSGSWLITIIDCLFIDCVISSSGWCCIYYLVDCWCAIYSFLYCLVIIDWFSIIYGVICRFSNLLFLALYGIKETPNKIIELPNKVKLIQNRTILPLQERKVYFNNYLKFISKYTRTIPFIILSRWLRPAEDRNIYDSNYGCNHQYTKIYDVDKDKLYDLNSNFVYMAEEDKQPMELIPDKLKYRINYHATNQVKNGIYEEKIVHGFLPYYIEKSKLSPLFKSQKDKQLDKAYIQLDPTINNEDN